MAEPAARHAVPQTELAARLAERLGEAFALVRLERQRVLEKRAGEQRTLVAAEIREVVPSEVFQTPAGKSWG